MIAFPSLLFSILHIKLLFWAHHSKVCVEFYAESCDAVWLLTDGFQTSNFTTHRRGAEPWGLVSNFQHHCSGMQGNLLSFKFQILLILTLTLLLSSLTVKLFFLWLRFSIKCPRSALQDNTNTTGRVRGILNIKSVKFLILSYSYLVNI